MGLLLPKAVDRSPDQSKPISIIHNYRIFAVHKITPIQTSLAIIVLLPLKPKARPINARSLSISAYIKWLQILPLHRCTIIIIIKKKQWCQYLVKRCHIYYLGVTHNINTNTTEQKSMGNESARFFATWWRLFALIGRLFVQLIGRV